MSHWDIHSDRFSSRVLQRMITLDRVPHAILLSGPPQIGKRRTAIFLAQALNCDASTDFPCGDCRSCRRISDGKHSDIEIVNPGGFCQIADHDHSRSKSIGICAVRRLETVGITQPYEGRKRVFIIDPADALTREASDAFLKTLEEPPGAVILILLTSRPGMLTTTIRSRCREIFLNPLSIPALTVWIEREYQLSADEAKFIARLARGRIGLAEEMLRESEKGTLRHAQTMEIRRLSRVGLAERFKYAATVSGRAGDSRNAQTALIHWIDWWHDLLLVHLGCADRVLHQDQLKAIEDEAQCYEPVALCRFLLELQRTVRALNFGGNPRLSLDVLLTKIPNPTTRLPEVVAGAN